MKKIPNILTIIRLSLTPVFIILAFYLHTQRALKWALIVYIVAAITDWLDGLLARKLQAISDFGKLWDPLADKFIVLSALAALVWKAPLHLSWIIFVVITLREVLVSVLREVYAKRGIIMQADIWGKLKTVLQMVGSIAALFCWAWNLINNKIILMINIWFWCTTTVAIFSGINYWWQNRKEPNHP